MSITSSNFLTRKGLSGTWYISSSSSSSKLGFERGATAMRGEKIKDRRVSSGEKFEERTAVARREKDKPSLPLLPDPASEPRLFRGAVGNTTKYCW